jgi:hypothetical protein
MTESTTERPLIWSEEFRSLYNIIKKADLGLIALEPDTITGISQELSRQEAAFGTKLYIVGSTLLVLTFSIATVLILCCSRLAEVYSLRILQLATHTGLITYAAVVFAISAIILAVVEPLFFRFIGWLIYLVDRDFNTSPRQDLPPLDEHSIVPINVPKSIHLNVLRKLIPLNFRRRIFRVFSTPMNQIDLTSIPFLIFCVLFLYIAFPVAFSALIYKYPAFGGSIVHAATLWLVPPCIILAFFTSTFIVANIFRRFEGHPVTTQYIALDLMRIIEKLSVVGHLGALGRKDRSRIIDAISDCGYRIRRLYPQHDDPVESWAHNQMILAGNNFLMMAKSLYFPQQGAIRSLCLEICSYLNIFLFGNLHELPRRIDLLDGNYELQPRGASGWRKLILYLIAFAYLVPCFRE